MKQEKKFLFFLFFLSLFIRGLVFHFYLSREGHYWQVDSSMYHDLAVSISDGKGATTEEGKPAFYRLPGYPIFLSVFYRMFGHGGYTTSDIAPGSNGVLIALWVQVVLGSFIPVLVFLLSQALFSGLILAKVASLWSTFHLGFILYSGFFMTETLFILFFLWFLILFFSSVHLFFCSKKSQLEEEGIECHIEVENGFYKAYVYGFVPDPACDVPSFYELFEEEIKKSPRKIGSKITKLPSPILFAAGLLLGITGIIRPVGHYLLVLVLLITMFSHGGIRTRLRGAMTLFGGWIFPVAPWLIRNFVLTGHLFFHTLPGGHFLYLSASRVAMHEQNCSYWQARTNLTAEVESATRSKERYLGRKLSEIEECKVCEGVALKYFKKRPILALKNWFTDILRTSLSLYSAELLYLESGRNKVDYFKKGRSICSMFTRYLWPDAKPWVRYVIWGEILAYLFILLGFVGGFVKVCIKRGSADLCAWARSLLFITLFIVIALAGGYARMRLPVETLMIILSLQFWLYLLGKFRCKLS